MGLRFIFVVGFVPLLFGTGKSLECSRNSVEIDWTASTTVSSETDNDTSRSFSYSSNGISSTCDESICATAEYDLDYTLNVNNFRGNDDWDFSISRSASVDAQFCGNSDICDVLAGGNDGCNLINFNYQQWFPQSCDNLTEYDATTIDYNVTYKYACCTTDNCNDDYDFSSCTRNNEIGDTVSGLFGCWRNYGRILMKYLNCNWRENLIYRFVAKCREDGGGWSDNPRCRYILTCPTSILRLIKRFGQCACSNVLSSTQWPYASRLISEILETQWNRYCPDIDLTCTSDGELELNYRKFYVYWRFYINNLRSLGDGTGTLARAIKLRIANYLRNMDDDLIDLSADTSDTTGSSGSSRRLTDDSGVIITAQIRLQTQDDADIVEGLLGVTDEQLKQALGYNITSVGYNKTEENALYQDDEDDEDDDDDEMKTTEMGGEPASGDVKMVSMVVSVISIFGVAMAMFGQ